MMRHSVCWTESFLYIVCARAVRGFDQADEQELTELKSFALKILIKLQIMT